MKLLLVGSSGLVGRQVLAQALADARVTAITALGRKPLPPQPKLASHQVDFENLPDDATLWAVDAVISTLGTTLKDAGSQDAFRRIDHGYNLAVARQARHHGVPAFVLNSAMGADAASGTFYLRSKGELERDVRALAFPSLTLARPGLIGGARERSRPAEAAAQAVLGVLGPLLPRRFRINPAPVIARALVQAAVAGKPGVHIITSDQMVD